MPIIKQSKQLDGPNSIYKASRTLAKRQVKNMSPPVEEPSGQPVQQRGQDVDGLIPQLLQNVSDINGLLTSLRMVGESDATDRRAPGQAQPVEEEEDIPRPKKRRAGSGRTRKLRGGALSLEQRSDLDKKIKKGQRYIQDKIIEIQELTQQKDMNSRTNPTSPDEKRAKASENDRLRNLINIRNRAIKKKQDEIDAWEQILQKDFEEASKPKKLPAKEPREVTDRIEDDETLLEANMKDFRTQVRDGADEDQLDQMLQDIQETLPDINDYRRTHGYPELEIQGDRVVVVGQGTPRPSQQFEEKMDEEEEDEIPPPPPPDEDLQEGEDIEDFIARFDFSNVSKSTLLVILNQLKSLVKRGDLIFKRIIQTGVKASEADLNTLIDEVAEAIALKRFLFTHISQITRKSQDLGTYLQRILSGMLGKYIEALKTYIKRDAQGLTREQSSSIQENVTDEPEDLIEGAGRLSVRPGRNIVLSDAVRRISKYDRKYIL
jgi:hypothetical protein